MRNKTLIKAARNILKELLPQCTEEQQMMFKKMYCHTNLDSTIEEAIDHMDPAKMDWAITQAERTLGGEDLTI